MSRCVQMLLASAVLVCGQSCIMLDWVIVHQSFLAYFVLPQGLRFPLSHLKALRQLQEEEELAVSQLDLPSDDAKLNMALALWTESLLEVCKHNIWNKNTWSKLIDY